MSTTQAHQRSPVKHRTHYLYLAVIAAVAAGIVVGIVAPAFAVELKPLGTGFVALIKMMIQPVIFCTIVLGVGSVANAARVGKVGGLALLYFVTMSTFALGIGMVVGNLLKPGEGLRLTDAVAATGQEQAAEGHGSTTDFLLGIIPDSMLSSLTSGEVLQTLLVALLIGFALQQMGRAGKPILTGIGHVQRLVFRVLSMIMWAAPVGAFGAIAAVVGATGADALKSLAVLMVGFYVTCALFVFGVLGTLLKVGDRRQRLLAAEVPRSRVPHHRLDVVVRVGPAAPHRQDGARRRRQAHRGRRRPDRLLVQPRRHRDLPDDGLAVHRPGPRRPAVDRRAGLAAAVHDDRLEGRRGRHGRRHGHPGRRPELAPSRAGRRRRPHRRHRPVHERGPRGHQLRRQRHRHRARRSLDRRPRPRAARPGARRQGPVRRGDHARRPRLSGEEDAAATSRRLEKQPRSDRRHLSHGASGARIHDPGPARR